MGPQPPSPRRKRRWYAYWYFSIALGFLLLAVRYSILGERPWLVSLRVVIALAFALLGYCEWRASRR